MSNLTESFSKQKVFVYLAICLALLTSSIVSAAETSTKNAPKYDDRFSLT